MNKETVQKNVYILHLNYRTVYCPKKALNSEMGNTVILNITRFEIDTTAFSPLFRAILGWSGWWFTGDTEGHVDMLTLTHHERTPLQITHYTGVHTTPGGENPVQFSVWFRLVRFQVFQETKNFIHFFSTWGPIFSAHKCYCQTGKPT